MLPTHPAFVDTLIRNLVEKLSSKMQRGYKEGLKIVIDSDREFLGKADLKMECARILKEYDIGEELTRKDA